MSSKGTSKRNAIRASTMAQSRASTTRRNTKHHLITDNNHLISNDTKLQINQILTSTDKRINNNVRNSKVIHGTIGITIAEMVTIGQLIINSTKKGVIHRLTKRRINFQTNNASDISSRDLLKKIIEVASQPKTKDYIIHCKNYVLFLEKILNDRKNFVGHKSFENLKLRLITDVVDVNPKEINNELRALGINISSNA
jgi:hypothetical protein